MTSQNTTNNSHRSSSSGGGASHSGRNTRDNSEASGDERSSLLHDLELQQAMEGISTATTTISSSRREEVPLMAATVDNTATSSPRPSSVMAGMTSSTAHLRFLKNDSSTHHRESGTSSMHPSPTATNNIPLSLLDDSQASFYSEQSEYDQDDVDSTNVFDSNHHYWQQQQQQQQQQQNQRTALMGGRSRSYSPQGRFSGNASHRTQATFTSDATSVGGASTAGSATSSIFAQRKDLREVDQSLNLMDASRDDYEDPKTPKKRGGKRVPRRARSGHTTTRSGMLNVAPMVDVRLDGSDSNSKLPSLRRLLSGETGLLRTLTPQPRSSIRNTNANNHNQRRLFYGHFTPSPVSAPTCTWGELVMESFCKFCILGFIVTFIILLSLPQGTYWVQKQMGIINDDDAAGGSQDAPSPFDSETSGQSILFSLPGDPTTDRLASLQNMILTHQVTDENELLAPNTPQQLASHWLAQNDPAQLPMILSDNDKIIDAKAILQRYAMVTLYVAMNGPAYSDDDNDILWNETNWNRNDKWLSEEPICQWWGVDCEDDVHIVHLNVSHNLLHGSSLPSELVLLTDLRLLDLSHNRLSTSIPEWIGQLSQLEYLVLTQCNLEGSLPAGIGNLTNLEELAVSYNHLKGSLPSTLNQLTGLRDLHLDHNSFTGPIPHIGNLEELEVLNLYKNELTGMVPHEMFRLKQLQELKLDDNYLRGTLPPELETMIHLEYLSIGNNMLSGTLPDIFYRMSSLHTLELHNNHFRGPIAVSLGNATGLETLLLDHNPITGTVPSELGYLKELHTLRIQETELSGSMPSEICDLKGFLTGLEILIADCEAGQLECQCCDRCN